MQLEEQAATKNKGNIMKPRQILPYVSVALTLIAANAPAETIAEANYKNQVKHYGHFALGEPHEYSHLSVTTDKGRKLVFKLPENEAFEDLKPRLAELSANSPKKILTIVSKHGSGSRLVLFAINNNQLEISAQSHAIGLPNRWLNPVGVADLDGDGQAEISAVITPHIGGILKVYKQQGKELVEIAAMDGFSNHAYRSTELALSTPSYIAGKMQLLVPDDSRQSLRIIALVNNRLIETGRCRLPSFVIGPVKIISPNKLSIGLDSGVHIINPDKCIN